jgi:hypothetical protein
LAAQRELLLELDPPRGPFEDLHQRDAEQPMPLAQALIAGLDGVAWGSVVMI